MQKFAFNYVLLCGLALPGLPCDCFNVHAASAGRAGAPATLRVDPSKTIMQCLGTNVQTRACYFQHVFFELKTQRFVIFGEAGSKPELFGDAVEPGQPWIRLSRAGAGAVDWKSGDEFKFQFFMEWQAGENLPAPEAVVHEPRPLHLRTPLNTPSIGHLIRDNLQSLIDLPLRFGLDPMEFDWVRWESTNKWVNWQSESNTAKHYRGLVNNRPSTTWRDVLANTLNNKPTGVKYIQFEKLIAGRGPSDIISQLGELHTKAEDWHINAWAHMCSPFPFTDMRSVAYRNHGLEVRAVADMEPFVLFLDGQAQERRHLSNAPALIPKLQKRFLGMHMQHVEISRLPLQGQLELLAKATIMVTNIGSRSFRLIYLQNGAQVILVGPPEYEFKLYPPKGRGKVWGTEPMKKVTPFRLHMPFREIDWCWGFIGYVNMLRYHVESEAEVKRNKRRWLSWMDARNTDVVLNEEKLSMLLQVALACIGTGDSYQGAGALSAYK